MGRPAWGQVAGDRNLAGSGRGPHLAAFDHLNADGCLPGEAVLRGVHDLPRRLASGADRAGDDQATVPHLGATVADNTLAAEIVIAQDRHAAGGVEARQIDHDVAPRRIAHTRTGKPSAHA